jgi:hypothetical protein
MADTEDRGDEVEGEEEEGGETRTTRKVSPKSTSARTCG